MAAKKCNGSQKTISQNLFVIFGRIFTVIVFYENFEMEVEQANFVTHFIISVQLLLYLII